jgi:hypothetical protein
MAFQAVVHGAGGIVWWGANFISANSDLWQAIKRTARDLNSISGWLVEEDSPLQIQAVGLEVLLKQPATNGEKHLLIAVNPQPQTKHVELSLAAPKVFKSVRDILKQQPVEAPGGRFTETFEPYSVRLYEMTIADRP